MSGIAYKSIIAGAGAVMLSAQGGCMTRAETPVCSVTGAEYLSPAATAEEVCRLFNSRLDEALQGSNATNGEPARQGDWSAEISVSKRGSIEARLIGGGAEATSYPVVAVDVMDRPIGRQDIASLADAAAAMLLGKTP